MADSVTLPIDSVYKDTRVFEGDNGPEFGPIEVPVEFEEVSTAYKVHRVTSPEVGFLDAIAILHFGRGNERFQRMLMIANAIIDPEVDMFVGQNLLIPPRAALLKFQGRAGRSTL